MGASPFASLAPLLQLNDGRQDELVILNRAVYWPRKRPPCAATGALVRILFGVRSQFEEFGLGENDALFVVFEDDVEVLDRHVDPSPGWLLGLARRQGLPPQVPKVNSISNSPG
jgi:hypothetical protein